MLESIKKRLNENKINVMKISTGTMVGQLISVITLPFITRLFGAEAIGVWALLNSMALIIRSFSDLGMTQSIMIEDEDIVVKNYKVITTLALFISIFASILITVYYYLFANILVNPIFMLVLVMIIIFTTQQIQICYTWLNRKSEYNVLMKNPIIHNGVYGLTAIVLGLLGYGIYGFFIGHAVGQIVTLIHMKTKIPNSMFTFKLSDYKTVLSTNKRFVFYQMPANVLNDIKQQLPILLLEILWGSKILGYYAITVRLLQIPSSLLANSIGRVFFQTISGLKRAGRDIRSYVLKNIKKGMVIASIPILLIMAFGDILVKNFLGDSWVISGYFIQILAFQFLFMFVMNTIQGLSTILEKQNYAMFSSGLQTIGFIIGALVGKYIFDNIYITLILMSCFFIIIHIGYIISLFNAMGIPKRKYLNYSLICIISISTFSLVTRYFLKCLEFIDSIYMV